MAMQGSGRATLRSLSLMLKRWRKACGNVGKLQAERWLGTDRREMLKRWYRAFVEAARAIAGSARMETLQRWSQAMKARIESVVGNERVETPEHSRTPTAPAPPPPGQGRQAGLEPPLARRLVFGIALIGLLAVSCGVWATTTPIAGAVIASGLVVVENNIKKVQHPSGGIVEGRLIVHPRESSGRRLDGLDRASVDYDRARAGHRDTDRDPEGEAAPRFPETPVCPGW